MTSGSRQHLFFAALLVVILVAAGPSCSRSPEVRVSPDTVFNLLDDSKITLRSRQGEPTLVVFFALNNPLAVDELKRLDQLPAEFGDTGLELIAVAQSSDRPDLVRTVMHHEGFLFSLAMDPDGSIATAFGGLSATPAVYLVSPLSEVVYTSEGPADLDRLKQLLSSY